MKILKNVLLFIVHIGHLGTGGAFGIAPVGMDQNKFQRWLREVYNECKKRIGIPNIFPNIIVFGGEVTEGLNPKRKGEDILTARMEEQIKDSANCIMEWIGPETQKIILLHSHLYHGLYEVKIENLVATKIKAELKLKPEIVCSNFVEDKFFGKTLRFTHGAKQSITNLAAVNERTIRANLLMTAMEKTPKVDCHFQYHQHRYSKAIMQNYEAVWCPAFKILDPSGEFMNADDWLPDIGIVVTTVEERFGQVRINNDFIGPFHPPFRRQDLEEAEKEFSRKYGKVSVPVMTPSIYPQIQLKTGHGKVIVPSANITADRKEINGKIIVPLPNITPKRENDRRVLSPK